MVMLKSPRRLLLTEEPATSQAHQNYHHAINVGSALLLVFAFVFISCTYLCCRRLRRSPDSSAASFPDPKSELDAIPIVVYSRSQPPDSESVVEFEMENCAICLAEFEIGENVRVLPRCMHVFHVGCIDGWLVVRSLLCPVCRDRTIQASPQPKKESCNASDHGTPSFMLVEFAGNRNFVGSINSYF